MYYDALMRHVGVNHTLTSPKRSKGMFRGVHFVMGFPSRDHGLILADRHSRSFGRFRRLFSFVVRFLILAKEFFMGFRWYLMVIT